MKKNKIVLAYIVVVVLTLSIIAIGLIKFARYLNKPIDNFNRVLDGAIENLESTANAIEDLEIYNLFSNGTYELNIDSTINVKNFGSTTYSKYTDNLNNASYLTNIKVSQERDYLFATSEAKKGNSTFRLYYVESEGDRLLRSSDETYKVLTYAAPYLRNLKPSAYLKLLEIVKEEIKSVVKETDIKSSSGATALNEKIVNVDISSYSISGKDLTTLLRSIIIKANSDSELMNDFMTYYGMTKEEVSEKFLAIINNAEITFDKEYKINAYNRQNTKEPIKLSITVDDVSEKEVFSYSMDKGYTSFEYKSKGDTLHIKITKLDSSIIFSKRKDDEKIEFVCTNASDHVSGTIQISPTSSSLPNKKMDFDYTISPKENDTYAISLEITYYPIYLGTNAEVNVNSSILLNKKANISYETLGTYDIEEFTNTTIKTYIDRYLVKFNDTLNSIGAEVESENVPIENVTQEEAETNTDTEYEQNQLTQE